MKLSNKAIAGITITSAVVIATSTVLANLAIRHTNPDKPVNPLDRDKTYHHYSIIDKLSTHEKLNNLINFYEFEGNVVYFIDEQIFLNNFKSIITDTFKTIPAFKRNYLNYEITCNYKIKDTKSISIDLVWQEPGNKNKFFDQFILNLETV